MDALEEMLLRMKEMHMPNPLMNHSSDCPMCGNTGWVQTIRDGAVFCKECSCGIRKKQIMASRIEFASIPKGFEGVRLHNFDLEIYKLPESRKRMSSVFEAVQYWLKNLERNKDDGMGLYLYSNSKGSGKTRMAASIANELIYEYDMHVRFATSLQILNEIKSTWDGHTRQSESQLLNMLTRAEVLVIDDFGTERVMDWIGERFYHIVNERYVNKMITIYTSNWRLEDLTYDARICNRIKERTYRLPFPEESVRDIIAQDNMARLVKEIKEAKK